MSQVGRQWSLTSGSSSVQSESWAPRRVAAAVLASTKFDIAIGLVILANCASIGVEQSLRLEDLETTVVDGVEHGFLVIYMAELGLRFYVHGWRCLRNPWVRFDCLLVALGIATGWVLQPWLGQMQQLGPLMVLRTARLLRLARTVRLLIKFRELWMLVRGLLSSAGTTLHTLMLMTIILYIFGCVCIETVTLGYKGLEDTVSEEVNLVIEEHFRSLPIAMLTLVGFVTFDNIVYIYKPLIEASASFAFLFIGMILVVGIVLMNLVTAVVVNSALEQAMQDKDLMRSMEESRRKRIFKQLREVFMRLDEDGSGEVSRDEIIQMSDEDRELLSQLMTMEDPLEIFDALDVDGSGDLGIDEFVKGVQQVALSKTPIEMKRMERQIESMHKLLRESFQVQDHLVRSMHLVLGDLHGLSSEPMMASLGSQGSMYSKSSKWRNNGPFGSRESTRSEEPGTAEASETPPNACEEATACKTLPPWAAQLVQEVRQACASGIKSVMEEACPSLVAQAVAAAAATAEADASAERPGPKPAMAAADAGERNPSPPVAAADDAAPAAASAPLPAVAVLQPPKAARRRRFGSPARMLQSVSFAAARAGAGNAAAQRASLDASRAPAVEPSGQAQRSALKGPAAPQATAAAAAAAAAASATGRAVAQPPPESGPLLDGAPHRSGCSSGGRRRINSLVPRSTRPVLLGPGPEVVSSGGGVVHRPGAAARAGGTLEAAPAGSAEL